MNPDVWELDEFWRAALQSDEAPDIIVSLNERLQKACQEVMDTKDELRDWARQHMPKP